MNTKLRCIVVDDEPLASALIRTYVERTPFLTLVCETNSSTEALCILSKGDIDIAFMDIQMPHLSGTELARLVPPSTKIIFTTAFADYALEGFKVHAFDYLLKPISYEEFLAAALRAKHPDITNESSSTTEPGFLVVKSEYRIIRIPIDSIDYIEGLKDYVKIFCDGSTKATLTLMSMRSLEESLPKTFMRIHRSFIVNMNKVRVIERNCILINGTAIPIAESNRKKFYAALGMEE